MEHERSSDTSTTALDLLFRWAAGSISRAFRVDRFRDGWSVTLLHDHAICGKAVRSTCEAAIMAALPQETSNVRRFVQTRD